MSEHTKKEALTNYCLHRGDANLILGQRISAWCGHGPVLEQDIALTNLALDLVGQARNYYQYAAELEGKGRTEDDLAYLRDEHEYLSPLLCEIENGDWGQTLMRQFLYDAHHFLLLRELQNSSDEHLAAIAAKSLKEVTYHRRYSSEWVVRLGDGTPESHRRMQQALNETWRFSGELLTSAPVDDSAVLHGLAPKPESLADEYHEFVGQVLAKAQLSIPETPQNAMQQGGKQGRHTEKMGYLLAEMQYLQRVHPGATW
jgi:ring-1,2-phenylacetyl-CoA epoxidase subunit PaaC